jgi:cobalt-zinc-cadmium efflux system outer membrane protein
MMAAQPMLRMRERAVARESHGLKLARREGLPDLVLGAGYMAMKEGPDSWMGMLGVTLPVWRGAKVGPLRREAEARLEQARAERDAARNDALRMLREAWGMAAGARAMARGYADAVIPQAEQALASARTAYETHAIGFLDLLDAQRSWRQARLAHQQALAEWRLALVELARVAGDGAALGLPPGDEGGTDE